MNFFGVSSPDLLVVGSLVLGALVILVRFMIGRRTETTKNEGVSSDLQSKVKSERFEILTPIGGDTQLINNGKRSKNKKRREAHQDFTHSWMVGALKGHTGLVLDMDFSGDGKFLASCAEDRTVHIWCTKDLSSKEKKSLRVNIDYDYATNVRVSPDGKAFIVHKSLGNNIEVYGLKKKNSGFFISATPVLEFTKKHEEDIVGMDIACNGRFIMTCSKKNDLIIWDLKGEIIGTVDTYLGSTHKARISPCGRFVAASGFTPDVKVWEVRFTKTGEFKQIGKAFDLAGHSSGIYDFDFCADSSQMASVSKDGNFKFYDTKVEFEKGEDPHLLISGPWENTTTAKVALSPNGEVLAVGHGTSLSFFSTISGQLDTTIEDLGFSSCLTFDASGEYLLIAVDKQIKIFRNVAGYRVAIQSAKRKLDQKQSSATRERLEKKIADATKFLESLGERLS